MVIMQKLALLLALGAILVESAPAGPPGAPSAEATAPIVKQETEISHDGHFKNGFQTGNGIVVDEVGYVKSAGPDQQIQVIQGSNAYTSPEGQVIQTQYIADENGYQPVGDHLPTPPPADPAIIRSLQYLASLPSTPEPPPQPQRIVYQQPYRQ